MILQGVITIESQFQSNKQRLMKINQNPQIKLNLILKQDTCESSERVLKLQTTPEESFSAIRQKVHWKILLGKQVTICSNYVLLELLINQKYFDLYLGLSLQFKEKVIVKIIDKHAIRQNFSKYQPVQNWKTQFNELQKKLFTQNYVLHKLYNRTSGVFLIKTFKSFDNSDCFVKVTQNYYGQTLEAIIIKRQSLPVGEALAILKQIIFAISELHKEGIILTELRPSFIYFKNGVFKIADLSSMRKVHEKFLSTLNVYHSYQYKNLIAPELIVCPDIVDIKSEIWALGILFFQMIAHNIPYQHRAANIIKQAKSHHIQFKIKSGQIPTEVQNFIESLLHIAPDDRISWKKLINHSIFTNNNYFNSLKIMPIVDARITSLKKKENDVIPQQIIDNQLYFQQKIKEFSPTIKHFNSNEMFQDVKQTNQINQSKLIDVQTQTYLNIKQINLMALKSKYIFQEILLKIQTFSLIDKKRRSHIETIFLISQRCFLYIVKALAFKNKNIDPRIENYIQQLKKLLNEIKQFTTKFEDQFFKINSSAYYVSNDLFSTVLRKKKIIQKGKFFKGEEGLDFSTQEQVNYTQEKYISKILNELKGDDQIVRKVMLNLKYYKEINKLTLEDIEGKYQFTEAVDSIINQQQIKSQ